MAKQGFNRRHKQIVILIDVEDVQQAVAERILYARDGVKSKTITEAKALELMETHEESLIYAYNHGWNGEWKQSIRDVLSQYVTDEDRTETIYT